MDYRQLQDLLSSHQALKTKSAGGGQWTQKRYMCGTPWMIRTNKIRWLHSRKQRTGWYGSGQLLSFNKDEKKNISGFKSKGWCRRTDITVTKFKSTFEYWVKSQIDVRGSIFLRVHTHWSIYCPTTQRQRLETEVYCIYNIIYIYITSGVV